MRWAIPSRSERRASSSGVSSLGVLWEGVGADEVVFVEVEDEEVVVVVEVADGSVEVSVGVEAVGVVGDDGSGSDDDGSDAVEVEVGIGSGIDGDAERNAGSEYGVAISTGGSSTIHSRMWASAIGLLIRA